MAKKLLQINNIIPLTAPFTIGAPRPHEQDLPITERFIKKLQPHKYKGGRSFYKLMLCTVPRALS